VAEVRQTATFLYWHRNLRDRRAAARVTARIERLAAGNTGNVKSVGGGVSEIRINYGPDYRLYFSRRGETIYLLLCDGDKSTQVRDIETAKRLAKET
jgi:putative addiction module killer protein